MAALGAAISRGQETRRDQELGDEVPRADIDPRSGKGSTFRHKHHDGRSLGKGFAFLRIVRRI